MIRLSRLPEVVGEESARRYQKIQGYHKDVFGIMDQAFLVSFIVLACHIFEKRKDSFSLSKVDQGLFEKFRVSHERVIGIFKEVRDSEIAHKSKQKRMPNLPDIKEMDEFFNEIVVFYNNLSVKIEGSATVFDNSELEVKRSLESLFQNLDRGEVVRLKEVDIRWSWDQDSDKAMNKV